MRPDLILSLLMAGLFAYFLVESGQWSYRSALFPRLIGIAGLVAVGLLWLSRLRLKAVGRAEPTDVSQGDTRDGEWKTAGRFCCWLLGIFGLSYLVGQLTALPLFVFVFLRVVSGESWRFAGVSGAVVWAFLYVVFEYGLSVTWLDGLIWRWLGLS